MQLNSMILSFIFSVCVRLKAWLTDKYEKSLICNAFQRFYMWFDRSFQNSRIVGAVSSLEHTDEMYESRYGKVSKSIRRFFTHLLSPFATSAKNSRIVYGMEKFIYNILNISLRDFGIMFTIAGISAGVRFILMDEGRLSALLTAAILVFGLIFLLFKQSLGELIDTSFFMRKIGVCAGGGDRIVSHKTALILGIISAVLVAVCGVLPYVTAFFLLLCAAFSFYYTKGMLIAYITLLPFLPTMIMALGALALLAVFLIKSIVLPKRYEFHYSSLTLFVILMGAMFVWGVINSYAKMSSAKSVMVYLAFLTVYYLIINLLSEQKSVQTVINLMVAASVICSIYGIYQYFTPEELNVWQDSQMFGDIEGRIVSFFENPNVYGEYLILMIMLNFAAVINTEKRSFKAFGIVALLLSAVCMVLTYSRGCWIGIAVSVMLFLFIMYRDWFMRGIVLGCASLFFLPKSVITRLMSIGNLADSSTSYRVYIWEGTLSMLRDFWQTGIGVGTDAFNSVYPVYAYGAISAPHPHNLYLLLVSEMGILALVLFLVFVLFMIKKLFSVSQTCADKKLSVWSAAMVSALVGYLIQGMFDNVWYNYRVFLFFWIFVGLCAAVCIAAKKCGVKQHD